MPSERFRRMGEDPSLGIESDPEPADERDLDDVTPSEDPGIGSPDPRRRSSPSPSPDAEPEPADERDLDAVTPSEDPGRGVGAEQTPETRRAAERAQRLDEADVVDVGGEVRVTERAQERVAREAFEDRQERMRREADVDAVRPIDTFGSADLQFRTDDQGVVAEPTDAAVDRRRDERRARLREAFADEHDGIEADDVEITETNGELELTADAPRPPDAPGVAGDGPIASIRIPFTDDTVGSTLDRGTHVFDERITEPLAQTGGDFSGEPTPIDIGGAERGVVGEGTTRSLVGLTNIPAWGAFGVRATDTAIEQTEPGFVGGPIGLADPERTQAGSEVAADVTRGAIDFAREEPIRAGGMAFGAVAGGLGAGAAARAGTRGAQAAGRRVRTRADEPTPALASRTDIRAETPGPILRPEDVRQPASRPQTPEATGGLGSTLQAELRSFARDERGVLQPPRQQEPRPTPRDPAPSRPRRDLLEGGTRDRISGDITRDAQRRRRQAEGTFVGEPDPIGRADPRTPFFDPRVPAEPLRQRTGIREQPVTGPMLSPDVVGAGVGSMAGVSSLLDSAFRSEVVSGTDDAIAARTATDQTVGEDAAMRTATRPSVGPRPAPRPAQTSRARAPQRPIGVITTAPPGQIRTTTTTTSRPPTTRTPRQPFALTLPEADDDPRDERERAGFGAVEFFNPFAAPGELLGLGGGAPPEHTPASIGTMQGIFSTANPRGSDGNTGSQNGQSEHESNRNQTGVTAGLFGGPGST